MTLVCILKLGKNTSQIWNKFLAESSKLNFTKARQMFNWEKHLQTLVHNIRSYQYNQWKPRSQIYMKQLYQFFLYLAVDIHALYKFTAITHDNNIFFIVK